MNIGIKRILSDLQSCGLYFFHSSPVVLLSVALLVTSVFYASSSSHAAQLHVKVGAYENKPKIFTDEQNMIAGFWPELFQYISEKEQWEIEYVHGTWDEGLTGLQNNTIDMFPDVAYSEERADKFEFSRDPVLMSWSRLYVHDDNENIQSIRDLSGKKIAALENSVNLEGPDGLRELLEKFGVSCTFVGLNDYPSVFQAIADRDVDAGISNREFAHENAEKYNLKKTPILFQPINVKIAFPIDSAKSRLLREAIDTHITELKGDAGSIYYQLLDKYFESEIAEKRVAVLPAWLKTILLIFAILLFIFVSVIIATRIQVQRKTREIRKINRDLQQLATAIEQSTETIVITDNNGIIEYVNPAFETLTGYTQEEALGRNPRIIKSGQHDKAFYREMWQKLLRGDEWKGHLVNRKRDGSLFEEDTTISPVRNDAGEIVNFVAVKRDMSKEIALEKQLRQAQKMEAVGTLAGGIAHDFNNILTAIIGYSEMVKLELPPGGRIVENLDRVIRAGNRATDLVQQILAFSREGERNLQPLQVQLIVKEALKLLRASLPSTIQLVEHIDDDSRPILGDATQIHQVLMNLCTNAKDAIGDELGTLIVSLSEIEVQGADSIVDCAQIAPGAYLDLEVADTGRGMDDSTRDRIFDPFFTTKEKGKGTGLGLAVVHGIVKQHKGEITVTSEPSQGTIFHVYLPVIYEDLERVGQDIDEDLPQGRGERIMFIDDESIIANMMQQTLDDLGYQTTAFDSSIEALESFQKNSDDFDLVVTDMTMPEMTGIDLAKRLIGLRPNLPVILCTGFSEAIDETGAMELGIREYIKKPFDRRALAKAIRAALDVQAP